MGSSAGGVTLWGGDLGVVGGNVQNTRGVPRKLPQVGDGQDINMAVGYELEERVRVECPQISGNSETGDVRR